MSDRRCKTCRHFVPDPGEESYALQNGRCDYPALMVLCDLDKAETHSENGKHCKSWQPKEPSK